MSGMLLRIPFFHIIVDFAFGMAHDTTFDLKRFAVFGRKKNRSLTAGLDVFQRFGKGYDQPPL